MITQEELKEILEYDRDSGLFVWKKSKGSKKAGEIAGSISGHGYIVIMINKINYMAHRLAFLYEYGYIPTQVDHDNQNRKDNRLANLNASDEKENMKNKTKYNNNRSGVAGVNWNKNANRWEARISIDGKRKSLGKFVEFSEAVNARKNAEVLYGFHKNHGKDKVC